MSVHAGLRRICRRSQGCGRPTNITDRIPTSSKLAKAMLESRIRRASEETSSWSFQASDRLMNLLVPGFLLNANGRSAIPVV